MVTMRAAHRLAPLALAFVGLVMPSSIAAADHTPRPTGSGNNCVATLEHIVPGGPEARIASQTCFRTFAEAIAHATGGYTRLPAKAKPQSLTQSMLPESVESQYVIGIDYDSWHWMQGQGVQTWEADHGCDFSHWWVVSDIGATWYGRISSAKAYSGCVNFRHYENTNFGGAVVTCTCYYIGDAMNDRTRSLQFDD